MTKATKAQAKAMKAHAAAVTHQSQLIYQLNQQNQIFLTNLTATQKHSANINKQLQESVHRLNQTLNRPSSCSSRRSTQRSQSQSTIHQPTIPVPQPPVSQITVDVASTVSKHSTSSRRSTTSYRQSDKVLNLAEYVHDYNKPGNARTFLANVTNTLISTPYYQRLLLNGAEINYQAGDIEENLTLYA